MTQKHSPLPYAREGQQIFQAENPDMRVAFTTSDGNFEETGDFIVRACNNHYKLVDVSKNSAATLMAIYEWLDRVEKAGGATSLEGVAACHAMLTSLRKNASRTESLIMKPLREALAEAEVQS